MQSSILPHHTNITLDEMERRAMLPALQGTLALLAALKAANGAIVPVDPKTWHLERKVQTLESFVNALTVQG
jgi:hypothetical protein